MKFKLCDKALLRIIEIHFTSKALLIVNKTIMLIYDTVEAEMHHKLYEENAYFLFVRITKKKKDLSE